MDKPQIIAHVQKSLNFTLFGCHWIPSSAKFVVVGNTPRNTGNMQIYEINQGDIELLQTVEKPKGLRCGTFGASPLNQRNFATGDFGGRMQIWDLSKPETPVYTVDGHSQLINCIDGVGGLDIGEGAPELVTGSRDGLVKIWDPRQKKDPVATMEPASGDAVRDCWAVAFGNAFSIEERCVAAGYDNGDVKLFDLRTMTLRWETNVKNGVCSVEFDRKDIKMNKLAVATLESKFHVFDLRTQHPKKGFAQLTEKAHKSTIWQVRHLPQNRDVFVTTGGNGSINLWKYSYPAERQTKDADGAPQGVVGNLQLLQNVGIATQPLSGFDWHPDKMGLCVCTGFDQVVRLLIVTRLNTL